MPLIIPPAPQQSIDAMRAAMPLLAHRPALSRVAPQLSAALAASPAASLSPTLSHKIYTLGLSDLAAQTGNNLGTATLAGWRHTIASDEEVVTVDTVADETGSGYKFAALSSNPSAPGVQSEIAALGQDADIAAASYEVSLLQVPALGVRAVWLHDPSGRAADLLVPVAPVRSELTAGRRYLVSDFANALKGAAGRILADDDPRKGSA